ncbi:hypothetical protein QJS66_04925 [Kocuria rhizophila]|nr:hypothetical protein QJS66_04925 [Kocuria rhizophila]
MLRQRDSADLLHFVREQSVNLDHPHVVAPYGWAAEERAHVAIAMKLSPAAPGGRAAGRRRGGGLAGGGVACQLLEALRFVHTPRMGAPRCEARRTCCSNPRVSAPLSPGSRTSASGSVSTTRA